MKKIIMTVDFDVEVPDDTDIEILTLDLNPTAVTVCGEGVIPGAKVTGYTTTLTETVG